MKLTGKGHCLRRRHHDYEFKLKIEYEDVVAQHELREAASIWREYLVALIRRLVVLNRCAKTEENWVDDLHCRQIAPSRLEGRKRLDLVRQVVIVDCDVIEGSNKLDSLREEGKCVYDAVLLV